MLNAVTLSGNTSSVATSSDADHWQPTLDRAASTGIADVLARLSPAFTDFAEFAAPDRAVLDRAEWLPTFDTPLPRQPAGLDTVVDELSLAVRYGCRISDPGFSGFITTGATTAGIASATATAVAGGQRYLLHSFNALEAIGLRWLADACGLPEGWDGVFSSGGSVANLLALGAARQWTFEQRGVDVAQDGLPDGVVTRIYVSTEAHRTIHRAAGVLGLGRGAVREIPVDAHQRIDRSALQVALTEDRAAGIVPLAVVGIAGTTNTGAIDPLDDLLTVARRFGSWLHVDGAYGLIAAADPTVAARLAAVREADSVITDPHKWLATGVGVAATYVRRQGVLTRAFAEGAATYLEGSFAADLAGLGSQFDDLGGGWADMGVELSAPPRGVHVWAVLREIGRLGLSERIARHRQFATHLTTLAQEHPRLEALIEPELSIACVRYRPVEPHPHLDALTGRLLERLRRETPYAPSSTVVAGRLAIRPCYLNPRTTLAQVEGLAEQVVRLGDDECALR